MSDYLKELSSEFNENLKLNYDLKKKNWFNIGGKTKIYYKAKNLKELIKFLRKIGNKEKIFEKVRFVSLEVILRMIKNDLLKLGIEMDVFTSEREIISSNLLAEILKIMILALLTKQIIKIKKFI